MFTFAFELSLEEAVREHMINAAVLGNLFKCIKNPGDRGHDMKTLLAVLSICNISAGLGEVRMWK